MKKIIALLLSALFVVTMNVGCGGSSDYIDPNRTQLYIGVYDGGIGTYYLDEIIRRFEEKYADYEFGGKKGIQVKYYLSKTDYEAPQLINNAKYLTERDIFIMNGMTYQNLYRAGVPADLTDIMTEKVYGADGNLAESGATATMSIVDKMEPIFEQYLNLGTETQPKYYGLPYSVATMGFVYDKDLFESKGYYFNTDGNLMCKDGGNLVKSLGQDGRPDTADDGLAETWEQFKSLMVAIKQDGNIPFTFANNVLYYQIAPLISLWATYEGANDFMLNYTYKGVDSQFGEINEQNAWKLYAQDGRKAALIAAHDIISGGYYSEKGFYNSQTHLLAQQEYISSIRNSSGRIAMLMEGGWWENEARAIFDEMANMHEKYGYGKRNFGYYTMPKFIGTAGVADQSSTESILLLNQQNSGICVNRITTRMELCKLFLQFLHTQDSMAYFNQITGIFKPFSYTMSETQLSALTPYARECYSIYSDPNVKKVTMFGSSDFRFSISSKVTDKEWRTKVKGKQMYDNPLSAFFNNSDLTVEEYFTGCQEVFSQAKWEEYYNDYLNSL